MRGAKLLLLAAGAALIPFSPAAAQKGASVSPFAANRTRPAPVLTPAQRADYSAIFDAIQASDWTGANAKLDAMPDGPLHAVARAELYLAKGSPKVELAPLLTLVNIAPEIPQAAQLTRLAQVRGAVELPLIPQAQRLVWTNGQPRRLRAKSVKGDSVAADLDAKIQPLIRDNQPATAEALLGDRDPLLPPESLTEFQQRIGWSYYIIGDDASARRLADKARGGIGEWTLQAEWLAGLAAWRSLDCNAAGAAFETVARRATDLELSAAGHYWAARAGMMCGRPQTVQAHLRTAARMDETFYGLLSQRALGITSPAVNAASNVGASDWRSIATRPNVKDAIALVEIGRTGLADEAIRYQAAINPADHPALIRLAADLNLAATQMWLAHNIPRGVQVAMGARYPAPDWQPTRGWRVDPPLVFAHALQESGFRTDIVSPAGATGLMQVRPGTAGDIAKGRGEILDSRELTQPSANIEYGQAYLEYLRDDSCTGGLLPKVIAAYNAGPVPVSEWNIREFDRGDPLLYIESIPYWETRAYVPTILRNYWVYEQKAGRQQSPSRDALVQGLWPRFPGLPGPSGIRVKPRNFAAVQGRVE